MLPNWGFNLHCTSSGKPLLDFPASHPQPFSRPVNARDANYVIHLRGQQSTADTPPSPGSLMRRQQSRVRNLEWNLVTTQRRRAGLERGEKVKTKCSSGGMNLQWNGDGVREEFEEGWRREVYQESQICVMQTGGIWKSRGRKRKGRSSFGRGNFDSDDILATVDTLREE